MDITCSSQLTRRLSDSVACVLCYVLVPISGAFFLYSRRYGDIWSVRFHAFHSTLMAGLWAAAWGTLRLIEGISPWFLATLAEELRFVMNLGFILVWATNYLTNPRFQRKIETWKPPLRRLCKKRLYTSPIRTTAVSMLWLDAGRTVSPARRAAMRKSAS